MSDTEAAPAKAKASPKKKAPAKPKAPAAHPTYAEMVKAAVSSLKERGGSSRAAILKYILKTYKVGTEEKKINAHLKMALKAGVAKGSLKQTKGTGAAGSFRLGDAKAEKPAKKATPKKAAAAKKTPKKAGAKTTPKKKPAKKTKTPKKAAAAKPKKAKTPKVKAAKPAKKAAPKKKPAAKKPAAKKPAKK